MLPASPQPTARRITPDTDPGHATGGLGDLWRQRRLVLAFVVNDLKHRYTGSSIGFFWTVITPLLELTTYTFVFHVVLGIRFHPAGGWSHYATFLFCGMVTWFSVQDGLSRATTCISDHAHLIQKVNFEAITLPGYVVASAVFNQIIRLGVLAAALVDPGTVPGVSHAVLSGLRESEVDAAVAAFAPLGLAERERLAEDGWASVRLSA